MRIHWVAKSRLTPILNQWLLRHFGLVIMPQKQYDFMDKLAKIGISIYRRDIDKIEEK